MKKGYHENMTNIFLERRPFSHFLVLIFKQKSSVKNKITKLFYKIEKSYLKFLFWDSPLGWVIKRYFHSKNEFTFVEEYKRDYDEISVN